MPSTYTVKELIEKLEKRGFKKSWLKKQRKDELYNIYSKKKTPTNGKVCPSYRVINPKTGRCVDKIGRIGSKILKTKLSPKKMSFRKSKNITMSLENELDTLLETQQLILKISTKHPPIKYIMDRIDEKEKQILTGLLEATLAKYLETDKNLVKKITDEINDEQTDEFPKRKKVYTTELTIDELKEDINTLNKQGYYFVKDIDGEPELRKKRINDRKFPIKWAIESDINVINISDIIAILSEKRYKNILNTKGLHKINKLPKKDFDVGFDEGKILLKIME
jgi:hypothetical protein